MKFTKPALSFAHQADLLLKRGLEANHDSLVRCLEQVNYYRFSSG